jgi:hypothetical protein
MATVFVLVGQNDYEGDTLLGVYESNEAADAAYQQYINNHFAFHRYNVHPIELGATAEYH